MIEVCTIVNVYKKLAYSNKTCDNRIENTVCENVIKTSKMLMVCMILNYSCLKYTKYTNYNICCQDYIAERLVHLSINMIQKIKYSQI